MKAKLTLFHMSISLMLLLTTLGLYACKGSDNQEPKPNPNPNPGSTTSPEVQEVVKQLPLMLFATAPTDKAIQEHEKKAERVLKEVNIWDYPFQTYVNVDNSVITATVYNQEDQRTGNAKIFAFCKQTIEKANLFVDAMKAAGFGEVTKTTNGEGEPQYEWTKGQISVYMYNEPLENLKANSVIVFEELPKGWTRNPEHDIITDVKDFPNVELLESRPKQILDFEENLGFRKCLTTDMPDDPNPQFATKSNKEAQSNIEMVMYCTQPQSQDKTPFIAMTLSVVGSEKDLQSQAFQQWVAHNGFVGSWTYGVTPQGGPNALLTAVNGYNLYFWMAKSDQKTAVYVEIKKQKNDPAPEPDPQPVKPYINTQGTELPLLDFNAHADAKGVKEYEKALGRKEGEIFVTSMDYSFAAYYNANLTIPVVVYDIESTKYKARCIWAFTTETVENCPKVKEMMQKVGIGEPINEDVGLVWNYKDMRVVLRNYKSIDEKYPIIKGWIEFMYRPGGFNDKLKDHAVLTNVRDFPKFELINGSVKDIIAFEKNLGFRTYQEQDKDSNVNPIFTAINKANTNIRKVQYFTDFGYSHQKLIECELGCIEDIEEVKGKEFTQWINNNGYSGDWIQAMKDSYSMITDKATITVQKKPDETGRVRIIMQIIPLE